MTQHNQLLERFKRGESLTVGDALLKCGCYALSQRVGELKDKGWDIRSDWVKSGKARFKRYYLHIEENLFA